MWLGIDVEQGKIVDSVNELNVLEPCDNFKSVLKIATECVESLTRIDVRIMLKPLKSFVAHANKP